jgi:hypothetical protein
MAAMAWVMVSKVVGRKVLGVGSGNGSRKVLGVLGMAPADGLKGSRKEGLEGRQWQW